MKSFNKTVVSYLIIAIASQCRTTATTGRSNDNMIFPQDNAFDNSRTISTATNAHSNGNLIFPQEKSSENIATKTTTTKATAHSNTNIIFPQENSSECSNTLKPTETSTGPSNSNIIFPQEKTSENNNTLTATATTTPASNDFHNLFATDLFSTITEGKSTQNIIYSPAAIQTCMALIFLGAEGDTASEMRKVLRFGEDDKLQIAERFAKLLKINQKTHNNLTDDSPKLKIINRLYAKQQLGVTQGFTKLAREHFDTQLEQVNFNDSKIIIENVNQWVSQQTENKIKNLLKENDVTGATKALSVNAIYFKANWLNAFSKSSTSKSKFYKSLNNSQEVDIMYNIENYGYAELPELNATALEMPYNNIDVSMMIILPNEIEGLQKLEQQLKNKDLNEITDKMVMRKVHAHIPKFQIEFDMDLKEPLKKMGLVTTFSSKANFKNLFNNSESQDVLTEVKHKAFLDINEAGSEAAAATFATLTNLSGIFNEPIFRADHPFVFAIRNKSVVYFAGHVATI